MKHGTHLCTSHYNYYSCSSLHIFHSPGQAGCPPFPLSLTVHANSQALILYTIAGNKLSCILYLGHTYWIFLSSSTVFFVEQLLEPNIFVNWRPYLKLLRILLFWLSQAACLPISKSSLCDIVPLGIFHRYFGEK
jgi:hypothetical protein